MIPHYNQTIGNPEPYSSGLYEDIQRAANVVANKWPVVEADDIRQEIWMHALNRPGSLDSWGDDEDRFRKMVKIGSQFASEFIHQGNVAEGEYRYGTKEVKSMLESGFLDNPDRGTLAEHHDLTTGMRLLESSNSNYWSVIDRKYRGGGATTDRKELTRSIDALTKHMNINRLKETLISFDSRPNRNFIDIDN